MWSSTGMSILVVVYVVLAVVSAIEANYPRALYWGAVSVLTYALLLMPAK